MLRNAKCNVLQREREKKTLLPANASFSTKCTRERANECTNNTAQTHTQTHLQQQNNKVMFADAYTYILYMCEKCTAPRDDDEYGRVWCWIVLSAQLE